MICFQWWRSEVCISEAQGKVLCARWCGRSGQRLAWAAPGGARRPGTESGQRMRCSSPPPPPRGLLGSFLLNLGLGGNVPETLKEELRLLAGSSSRVQPSGQVASPCLSHPDGHSPPLRTHLSPSIFWGCAPGGPGGPGTAVGLSLHTRQPQGQPFWTLRPRDTATSGGSFLEGPAPVRAGLPQCPALPRG